MKKGELKVFYEAPIIQEVLDGALEEALEKVGYERWASSYNSVEGVRDLAFKHVVKM